LVSTSNIVGLQADAFVIITFQVRLMLVLCK